MTSTDDELSRRLQAARRDALDWLRRARDGATPDLEEKSDAQILDRLLEPILGAGFELTVVNLGAEETPAYEVRWAHQGSSFVGFKQAPPSPNVDEAKLLACAALLQNDWCRARLGRGVEG